MNRALSIFHDDSSLFVAAGFGRLLRAAGWDLRLMRYVDDPDAPPRLSPRQLALGLDGLDPDPIVACGGEVCDERRLADYAVVASAKFPVLFRRLWRWGSWRFEDARP